MFSYKNSIARQFIFYILLFSMVITTVLTAAQLYLDYRFGVEKIQSYAKLIERSYLQSMTNALWVFDTDVVNSLMKGVSEIPDVIYVEVRDKEKTIASLGLQTGDNEITHHFPLVYNYEGKKIPLGRLKVVFTLQNLYQHLLEKVFVIAVTQGVKTLLVSLFIFFIFYRLVGRHLVKIANYASQLKSNTLEHKLVLDDKFAQKSANNEIGRLVNALNSMRQHFLRYRQMIEKDQQSLEIFKAQIEQSRDCMYIIDPDSARVLDVNQAVTQMLGYSRDELLNMKATDFSCSLPDMAHWSKFIKQVKSSAQGTLIEGRHKSRTGREIPVEVSAKIIHSGAQEIYVGFARDISERMESQRVLEFQAQHDQLTHLPNRILLKDRAEQMIKDVQREGGKVVLLFIDLDHFKHINDSYGHEFGDELLITVASRLNGCLRRNDTLARLGGDEFVALTRLDETGGDASALAAKLLDKLHEAFEIDGVKLLVNMSIGISIYPDDSQDVDLLLRNADAAMYKAKSTGRNNFQYYSADLTAQAELRIQMEHDINLALKNDEFVVYLQPQIDIRQRKVIGAEALVRWQHPDKGFMPPADFIGVAEQTGQINELDHWVLRHVARFIVSSAQKGVDIPRISVNFSGRDFGLDSLSDSIPEVLRSEHCDAAKIEVEITETQLMDQPESTTDELLRLQQSGLSIAIDDFGTGYSSLSYLKKMSIDKIKIDQAFVRDVCSDKNDRAIVQAIIALGKSLDLELIAEGVETQQQQEFLLRNGCYLSQGNLHSKPLQTSDFIEFMQNFA